MNFRKAAAIIIPLGLVIFLAGLATAEFLRIDCRFGLFIAEINKYGMGVFPTLYGRPYPDYPLTHTLLMYLASLGGRYVSMFTATLPSALAAVFTLLITYLIGARVSKWLGGYAVLLTLAAYEFLAMGRAPSPDMFIAAATAFSFYLIYSADEDNGWKRLLLVPLCLLAGFAIRGPIGLIIPTAVVFSYYVIGRNWKFAAVTGAVAAGLLAGCTWLLLGLCRMQGGDELVELFMNSQLYSRMESYKPFYFYFVNPLGSYALSYPLALLVIGVYFMKLLRKPDPADKPLTMLRYLSGWILIVLLGMSIPGTKHLRYIVAVIPAAGLAAGWVFINFDNVGFFDKLRKIILCVCRFAPFAIIIGLIAGAIVLRSLELDLRLPLFIPILMMLVFGAAMFALTSGIEARQRDFTIVAIAVATLVVVRVMTIEPIEHYFESSRKMTAEVEALKGDRPLYFCMLGPDEDELKYMINVPQEKRFIPRFIIRKKFREDNAIPEMIRIKLEELPNVPGNAIIISREDRFDKYVPAEVKQRFEVILTGKIGHKETIALQHRKSPAKPVTQPETKK